jgi:5-methylthioadenosine/S-adenosylhomocysteine deaminase
MKQAIDLLIVDGVVVTMDPGRRVVEGGAVAVDKGTITGVGTSQEMLSRFEAAETIHADGGIVMPGLINTHTHLATALFKGLAEDLPLGPWLGKVWGIEKTALSAETVALSSTLAMIESIQGGVTCAVDMYWFPEATAEAARRIGFRLAGGTVFITGDSLPDGLDAGQREVAANAFVERYAGDNLIVPMMMPHGTQTDSPGELSRVKALADRHGVMVNLHVAETLAERTDMLARSGSTPVRLLHDLGYLDGRSLLAHCVHVDDGEMGLMAGKASVAHNPMSNLKLASGIAPVASMLEAGVRVSLGTDGSMSGNDLDMWLAMRLAASLQKCGRGDTTLLKAPDVVAMATIEAARAMGLGERTGSLETGKAADIIVIRADAPHLVPLYDVYAHLVYSVGREDVQTVIIDGRVVMRKREMTTVDAGSVMDSARKAADTIRRK